MAFFSCGAPDRALDRRFDRLRITQVLTTLVAVVTMSVAAWRFIAATSPNSSIIEGGIAFLIGVAALTPYPSPERRGEKERQENAGVQNRPVDRLRHGRIVPLSAVGLGAGALALVAAAGDDRFTGVAQALGAHGQFWLWCAGIALVAWGLSGAPRLRRPTVSRRETIILSAILALALSLRVIRLDLPRVLVDEWHFINGVTYFWDNPTPQLLRPIGEYDPFPRVIMVVVADAVALFGRTFAALRVVPALIGTATVGAIYLLARELLDRRAALAAAALLATFPPFLHFSRLGLINSADPLFGTLALAFLARALRDGRRSSYVLAGVMLGLTQYFHEAGRLLFPALVALWIVALALTRTQVRHVPGTIYGFRVTWPFSWRGLAVGLLAALIVTAPLIYVQQTQPEQFRTRLQYAALIPEYWRALLLTSDFRPQLELIRDATLAFVRTPDTTIYYAGSTPLILPPLAPLFLLGLASALAGIRRPGAGVAVLWVTATILGNSLLIDPGSSVHFLVGLPAVALLMAVGLNEAVTRIAPRRSAAVVSALVIAIGIGQSAYYFGPHLNEFHWLTVFQRTAETHDLLLRAADLPPHSRAHVIVGVVDPAFDPLYAQDVLDYLTDDVTIDVIAAQNMTETTLLALPRATTQAFFVKPHETIVIDQIKRVFPFIGQPEQTPYPLDGETYQLYRYTPTPR